VKVVGVARTMFVEGARSSKRRAVDHECYRVEVIE